MPSATADFTNAFLTLLDGTHPEQVYQRFLEENSRLIPREFVQNHGIHFDLVLRKLALARDYATDFFYLAKSSADWNCVLVEIEKPYSQFFKNGTELHPDFVAALEQINRWRAWFTNRSNFEGFVDGTIKMLRTPIRMTRNPCYIKYVLVFGRRDEFEPNEQRRDIIAGFERDDFHILSYDSLLESLHSKTELYVGVRHNDHVQIISNHSIEEGLFVWMPSEQLRITAALKDDIMRHRDEWHHYKSVGGPPTLEVVLPKIQLVG